MAFFDRFDKELPDGFDRDAESEHLEKLFARDLASLSKDYDEFLVEGVGGSGIVLRARYKPFGAPRALKVPRKRVYEAATDGETPFEIDPELHALSKVSHPHIIRLYDALELQGNGHCVITEFVSDPMPLHLYAQKLCCSNECQNSTGTLEYNLRLVAALVYSIVDALVYMHDVARLLHFDIKPDNILISGSGRAYLTDLGFARDTSRYAPDAVVQIGFTWKYAHRSLRDPHAGARVSENAAKSKNFLHGKDLVPLWDVFALGRSIQEVLGQLDATYKESVNSFYTYNYLHVIASLCLDGLNGTNGTTKSRGGFASDRALTMPPALFAAHRFTTMAEVRTAFERLLGLRRLEDDVPELDRWAASTIRVSDLGITTLTPRVSAILEHPAFERLAREKQLGMLDTVFPTATHTRFQHTLGVYHAVREYLSALYYDPENPTFRILLRERDVRRVLAAALIHDIGQSTFGHEFEEINKEEFSHPAIGNLILASSVYRDDRGRTLRDLIEGTGPDCWQLATQEVQSLFLDKHERPLDWALHDILDGQLDADKMDYLIRDSKECRVSYGDGIDRERFLRSLTTTALNGGSDSALRLAVKRKGSASADAFALARYQLYQSLYWHHTFRATKAMFLTAATEIVAEIRSLLPGHLFEQHPLRKAFGEFVLGLKNAKEQFLAEFQGEGVEQIRHRLAQNVQPAFDAKYGEDRALLFLWRLSDGKNRALIEDLMRRRYYKRVLEIPLGSMGKDNWVTIWERFGPENRLKLQRKVEEVLRNTLESEIQSQSAERETLVTDRVLDQVQQIYQERVGFVIDLPRRGWTSAGDDPIFVSDYKRRHFRADAGAFEDLDDATLSSEYLGGMMRGIAFFRVFCEPKLHRIVTRVLDPIDIARSIATVIPGIKLRARR